MLYLSLAVCAALAVTVLSSPAPASVQVTQETGVAAFAFDFSQVTLSAGRWRENQNRTLNYLKFVDLDRLLYVYRANHGLSTKGATANSGWDAPTFPFRGHIQGHFLTALAQCFGQLRDSACRDRATTLVAELLKCQANNKAVKFQDGYLSGFPESDFTALEGGTLTNGNVPYYVVHKMLAGLLDVFQQVGDANAKTVLLSLASWVDTRTARLTYSQMQKVLGTEFGGMSEVLTDIYTLTGDSRWLKVAQRFEHASVLRPLAQGQDNLDGLHANTQLPKWIGAAREYKATGNTTYQAIAANAWQKVVSAHTYAIGGNSQAEHFRAPNAIASHLSSDTAESCNSYNMLKLTRELWLTTPNVDYFDFYERTLMNQMIGQQNPADSHGHVTYFHSMNPGGHRGIGPAWGGGTWSTDYGSAWCCQGTGLETNTKLMDSIYFHDDTSLYVNLFAPSVLTWSEKKVVVEQTTTFPVTDSTSLKITGSGSGEWALRVRIPGWTAAPTITVNGADAGSLVPGKYASISRQWKSGDVVVVKLPMALRLLPANDNKALAAVAYGPVVLVGNYGSASVTAAPTLSLSTLRRTSTSALAFSGSAGGQTVQLGPYYDAQGFNYVTYWVTSGSFSKA
ncbi:hypothetical protein QBC40DRAFT_268939 [Triangularia verruculosa]|uniref:Secreted protein n=1 Tax=Triangularia verruculosa TaxID=2587418 RepID=A0AAN6XC33_9PEZI|nr:hypothetical protein QBC40DRAFT_268939 [Triangularia verruculosa]